MPFKKVCFGRVGESPRAVFCPAGAAPVDRLPGSLRPGGSPDGFRVQVAGETWATGLHPGRFEVWERSLHPDYPATPAYRALFHTALAMAGVEEIDRIVTGLPASRFDGRGMLSWMEGVHPVAARRQVVVRQVEVVPQPVGGFMAALAEAEEAGVLAEGRVLVVDPGHFSFDWVLICGSALQGRSCGSSTLAMSAVAEADRIEQALQEKKDYVLLFGQKVEMGPYLERAAGEVVRVAVEKMRSALRRQEGDLDAVVLVGGGAPWWEKIVREVFPKAQVILPKDPILANARGFFELGAAGGG